MSGGLFACQPWSRSKKRGTLQKNSLANLPKTKYLRIFATQTQCKWKMEYLNQFHKEAMERTMRKIEESKKHPVSASDFAVYMKRNLAIALEMEKASK